MESNFAVTSSSESLSEETALVLGFSSKFSDESDCSLDSSVELSVAEVLETEEATDSALCVFLEAVETEEAVDSALVVFLETEEAEEAVEIDLVVFLEAVETEEVVDIDLLVVLASFFCSFFSLTFLKNLWIVIAAATMSAGW